MAVASVVSKPVPGVDYPRSWPEFLAFFPDEQACLRYLERVRWPDGFCCPACGYAAQAWRTKRGLLVCAACERQTSVTAGTLLAGTRTPLVSWFMSVWQLTNQKHGLSAKGLQRLLGLGSYETAWAHIHKLRRAMVRPGRDPLTDVVEVDESYVGGEESSVDGRETYTKSLVICAVEVHQHGRRELAGRIRMSRIPAVSRPPVEEFILGAVERGTRVRTDGHNSYRSLHGLGYAHDPIVVSRTGLTASLVMPHVHRVFSLLKRWLLGTYQGGVQPHQLDYYLDEFAFRYNRRRSRHRGLLFYRLLQEVVATEPIPRRQLVGGQHGRAGTGRDRAE